MIKKVLVIISCVSFILVLSSAVSSSKKDDKYYNAHTKVIAPKMPNKVKFCGETIDLARYDLKERFDRELITRIYGHINSLLLIKRANRYFPIIEPILKRNGIPDDFKYLACIESTLSPYAYSPARAAGMWQFIKPTGRKYGLEINSEIDERYNVEKETQAACDYLNYAYSLYHDWPTAAASYNCGYEKLSENLECQNIKSGLDIWMVEEVMRYVFKIMACKEFMEHPKKYGFYIKKNQLYKPIPTKDTVVNGKIVWTKIANSQGVSFYDLKNFNTWIRCDSMDNKENKSYTLKIPVPKDRFYRKKDKIYVHDKRWVIDGE